MHEVDLLTAAVAKVRGAKASAVKAIQDFAAYVKAHANDPALLVQFADSLTADADEIGQAVATNPLPTDPPA